MEKKINGVILKVSYESMGCTADIEILGKTMLQWVSLAFGENSFNAVDYTDRISIPELVKNHVNRQNPYTVVLFSDTPLITKKTVFEAVSSLASSNQNVLKLSRGYIFNTEYLVSAEKIYTEQTHYFEVDDFLTACSFKQVGLISDILKNRILEYHMENGVQFEDLGSTFIGCDVVIGKGVVIGPNNTIKGKSFIKNKSKILRGNVIDSCIIEENTTINSSQIYNSYIGAGTTVGPYAYIRPETVIGPNCRIGDFVEIKKSIIGEGCKVSHLSYVGDCEMGSNCNIGCGVVFVNYDGKNKHKTKVGDNVFIGSNSNIISPVTIKNGAFIAAGSTITSSVDENAFAIARARQVVKSDWKGNKYFAPQKNTEDETSQNAIQKTEHISSNNNEPENTNQIDSSLNQIDIDIESEVEKFNKY